MNTGIQSQPECAKARLKRQLPSPSTLHDLLAENRRERILLRRLLTLSERIYEADDAPREEVNHGRQMGRGK
ncbi:MAG: hypothetical protein H8E44_14875 [Planctomycetes bacterium]|nr:hypothetical protein [Planctomycetota bacterium]MBL7043550.1 hypothetical protein [Pirellulaceae bacterium]